MKTMNFISCSKGRGQGRHVIAFLPALAAASWAGAAPPADPLPIPFYSFDRQSPQIVSAQGGLLSADDVLRKTPEGPAVQFSGANLGLGRPGDELDGLSFARPVAPGATFALLFSVSRNTVGAVEPDPTLASMGIPYNVTDQARRIQAAGDLYISFQLFTRTGPLPSPRAGTGNNTLSVNNYDEGGTDYSANPKTGAGDNNAAGDPQDNVNSSATSSGPRTGTSSGLYFSASADSPSLQFLEGKPSGANVYFVPDPSVSPAVVVLFAAASHLGLQPADDLDALIVFDDDMNGVFNGTDQVLFSLAPDSPTLMNFTGLPAPAATVFSKAPGTPLRVFAPSTLLGLGMMTDQIDSLEFDFCSAADTCAARRGIRMYDDGDSNGVVNLIDYAEFFACYSGPRQAPGFMLPSVHCRTFYDVDDDTDVDLRDFRKFQNNFTVPVP